MRRRKESPIAFRVNIPLIAVTKDPITEALIPAGSMLKWEPGDFAGGVANVIWLKRRVLVIEADLFKQCERVAKGWSLLQR